MSSKNRFLHSLIAVAALTPTASAVAGNAYSETRAAASDTTSGEIAFASNLSTKLGDTLRNAERPNDAWEGKTNFVEITFVQSVPTKPKLAPGPVVARMSPIDAFKLASRLG
jgi:hypothetical protein